MNIGTKNIGIFAAGNLVCYSLSTFLLRALQLGGLPGTAFSAVPRNVLLPRVVLAAVVAMYGFIGASGWWRLVPQKHLGRIALRVPRLMTTVSGLCTGAAIFTSTILYSRLDLNPAFTVVLLLLLARGLDIVYKRKLSQGMWYSGLLLIVSAVLTLLSSAGRAGEPLHGNRGPLTAVGVYLVAVMVRLYLMNRFAKAEDAAKNKRYFAEEQAVASPALLIALLLVGWVGPGPVSAEYREAFAGLRANAETGWTMLCGMGLAGMGVFGTLVKLDKRNNMFCTVLGQGSTMLGVMLATGALNFFHSDPGLGIRYWTFMGCGAACALAAVIVPWLPLP